MSTTTPTEIFTKINVDKSRYDQDTYWGRVVHFFNVTDPRTLLVTNSTLKGAISLLDEYKAETDEKKLQSEPKYAPEKIYQAMKLKQSSIHPDTKEPIFPAFRMSAFVPMNLLIVSGMLSARSIPSTIFWQTVNQTCNVCVNYANRNASNEVSNATLFKNYIVAVTSSVGTAIGLNEWVKRSTFQPVLKSTLLSIVPFTAVAVANVLNIGMMRREEMTQGITVWDQDGTVYGKSAVAGRMGVAQTITSRILLIAPSMIVQPILMNSLEARGILKSAMSKQLTNLAMLTVFIGLFLPLGIGIYPQISPVSATELEPQFHNITNTKGEKVNTFYFNKGL
ncbi:predicted protein [Naegleria gruberi]|uniref:Sidoreflexin n=1 Tax=Naegleria gruberi TaxID=5762 RepID=D2VH42_NAEGR|nr:uncharacterized protein NAEGRDRAFT_68269 [Naegleria gruberi]EFC43915.1 predicted protein [Naegleria gruberi]|eukprot:XP_002676659.1 predicted protein [Naegleria gruberi strain NEG-M]